MTPDFSTCQGITIPTKKIECMMNQQVIDQLQHQNDPTTPVVITTPSPTLAPGYGYSDRSWMVDPEPRVIGWWEGIAFEDKIILIIMLITIALIVVTTLVKLLQKGKHNEVLGRDELSGFEDGVREP